MENVISYGGIWHVESAIEGFAGQLRLDTEKGLFHLECSVSTQTNLFTFFRQQGFERIAAIYGNTYNGIKVSLENCLIINRKRINEETAHFVINVETVFLGKHLLPAKEVFNCFQFNIPELIAWTGLCKYSLEFDDTRYDDILVIWEAKPPKRVFPHKDYYVEFVPYHGSIDSSMYDSKIELTQSLQVRFCYSKPCSLTQAKIDYVDFMKLVNIGCQDHIYNNSFECFFCDNCIRSMDCIPMSVYFAQPATHSSHTSIYDYLFDLDTLSAQPEVIHNWYNKADKLRPIVDLYHLAYSNDNLPIEVKFLNLVQALETYHSRFISNDHNAYKNHIETLLLNIPENSRGFHQDFLRPKSYSDEKLINLSNRLSDLFICNFEVVFETLDNSGLPYEFVGKIVNTRNYLTHYKETRKDSALSGIDLYNSLLVLQAVLEYYLLKELGFLKPVLDNLLRNRNSKIARQVISRELLK